MTGKKSFGRGSLAELLNYKSLGSVDSLLSGTRNPFPQPDRYDWKTGAPRWYSETIIEWLARNPKKAVRVTDPEIKQLVSEARTRLGI